MIIRPYSPLGGLRDTELGLFHASAKNGLRGATLFPLASYQWFERAFGFFEFEILEDVGFGDAFFFGFDFDAEFFFDVVGCGDEDELAAVVIEEIRGFGIDEFTAGEDVVEPAGELGLSIFGQAGLGRGAAFGVGDGDDVTGLGFYLEFVLHVAGFFWQFEFVDEVGVIVVVDDAVSSFGGGAGFVVDAFAAGFGFAGFAAEGIDEFSGVLFDEIDEAPVAAVAFFGGVRHLLLAHHGKAVEGLVVGAQDEVGALNLVDSLGMLFAGLGAVEEVDAASFERLDVFSHGCALRVGNTGGSPVIAT